MFAGKNHQHARLFKTISIFICSTTLFVSLLFANEHFSSAGEQNKTPGSPTGQKRKGTAIIITGAAAKISQEVALLEQLHNNGEMKDVVFISGASSGALNAAVLNAILKNKFSWEKYKNILFKLRNNDVFLRSNDKLPVDTKPLRALIERIVSDSLGYTSLSDLPYPTAFSIVNLKLPFHEKTIRLCNKKINPESDSSLNIIDVLMASAAYPIVFPEVKINNVSTIPDVPYADGGIAADHVPYQALKQFERYIGTEVEKVIIISRKRDKVADLNEELLQFGINKGSLFDKLGISPETISGKGFHKELRMIMEKDSSLANRTYVYAPDFPETFLMFDFNTLQTQYEISSKWAKENPLLPLREYILKEKPEK